MNKMDENIVKACIDACLQCAAACYHCAGMCLREEDAAHMTRCIRLDLECAELCHTAARWMALGSDGIEDICRLCAQACRACAEECGKHAQAHCRACAQACSDCALTCENI